MTDPRIPDLQKRIADLEQLTRELRAAIASMPCIQGSEQQRQQCADANAGQCDGCKCNSAVN